jgi:hypothetical protein
MADYAFTTTWQIAAPVAPIWAALTAVERWPQWWRGVEDEPAGPAGAPVFRLEPRCGDGLGPRRLASPVNGHTCGVLMLSEAPLPLRGLR